MTNIVENVFFITLFFQKSPKIASNAAIINPNLGSDTYILKMCQLFEQIAHNDILFLLHIDYYAQECAIELFV